jgi:plastocyanin
VHTVLDPVIEQHRVGMNVQQEQAEPDMTRTGIAAIAGMALVAGALLGGGTTWVFARGAMAGEADHGAMMAEHPGGEMQGRGATGSTALTEGTAAQTITVKDFAFAPANVRVSIGATVTWRNEDDARHIVVASDGSWRTPSLQKGQTASITFDKAGEYLYICSYHPGMTGRLLVE